MNCHTHTSRLACGLLALATVTIGLAGCAPNQDTAQAAPRFSVTYYPQQVADSPAPPDTGAVPAQDTSHTSQTGSVVQVALPVPTAVPPTDPPPTPLPAPSATPVPAAPESVNFSFVPPGPAALITGLRHERQTWNNCGPATISMLLSRYGRTETQREAARFLKPDKDDKNVSPNELVAYAQSLGYDARVVVGGDVTLLKTLVENGLPVILETWFIPDPNDEMGHYQLLMGYDGDTMIFYDSYEGPDLKEPVHKVEPLWKVFNRTAIVAWTQEQAPIAHAILGERMDDRVMYERALAGAQAEIAADPNDKFAWFNAGTNLLALGRGSEAAEAFDASRKLKLPWRMLWYQFGPYAAYFDQGRHVDVINLTTATLARVKNLEESLYWRARSQAAVGNVAAARRDLEQALRFNPNYFEARTALESLKASG